MKKSIFFEEKVWNNLMHGRKGERKINQLNREAKFSHIKEAERQRVLFCSGK